MLKMTAILLGIMIGVSAILYMLESLFIYIKNLIVEKHNNKREKQRIEREAAIKKIMRARKENFD